MYKCTARRVARLPSERGDVNANETVAAVRMTAVARRVQRFALPHTLSLSLPPLAHCEPVPAH